MTCPSCVRFRVCPSLHYLLAVSNTLLDCTVVLNKMVGVKEQVEGQRMEKLEADLV